MDIRAYIISKTVAAALSAAVAMNTSNEEATIRVLLMTNDYGGYYHEQLDYEINETGDGFQILSLERAYGNPVYSGSLEVSETERGYLLVNEVDLETYVKAVVPSEMPTGYDMEALKAQAICARTYAYKQLKEGKLSEYQAHVDDSVSYQVYNNYARSDKTDQAVDATRGLIMTFEGEPINAYFFSTSSGTTSTDEVWESDSAPCLKSIVTEYDESLPWYRWFVTFPVDRIETMLQTSGYRIGDLLDIQVIKRSQGGAAVACTFMGSVSSVTIANEYDIRALLSPFGLEIHRQDGSVITDFSLLPSAYFQVVPVIENDSLTGFTFQGGGYGHGVGMSQNGANEMAKQGYNCFEILDYYYQNFALEKIK